MCLVVALNGYRKTRVMQAQQKFSPSPQSGTLALVLAGGRGSRLHGLTDWRAKPAVHFGGKYRLIDFALSNCLNSGISRIGVLTQYMSHSLNQHIQQGWRLTASDGSPMIELLPAQQRTSEHSWYSGTADAIYQNIDIIRNHNPEYVLILAGDHIYKMDYREMLNAHIASNADLTIGAIETDLEEAKQFGVLAVDSDNRVTKFDEKPECPAHMPGKPDKALASMGIYIFNSQFLYGQLIQDHDSLNTQNDFGRNIIPNLILNQNVMAHQFYDHKLDRPAYWRDVGTLDAFWKANLELIGVVPELNLYDKSWPIRSFSSQSPPAKFVFDSAERCGAAVNSMICDGCIISGAHISNSLLHTNVVANECTTISESVVLPDCIIGEHCKLKRVILDRGCVVPSGMMIGYSKTQDENYFHISEEGVVLVTQKMLDAMTRKQFFKAA